MPQGGAPRFIADENVGKLARWLRAMGFDTVLFAGGDDSEMVAQALAEGRVLLTRDAGIMKRRLITGGRLKAILISSPDIEKQASQVVETLKLEDRLRPLTICIECNVPLLPVEKDAVKKLVPPYVFRTQSEYVQCPVCRRVYWKGTHWEAMTRRLKRLIEAGKQENV